MKTRIGAIETNTMVTEKQSKSKPAYWSLGVIYFFFKKYRDSNCLFGWQPNLTHLIIILVENVYGSCHNSTNYYYKWTQP